MPAQSVDYVETKEDEISKYLSFNRKEIRLVKEANNLPSFP